MDNHRPWVPGYDFYLGIVKVIGVAERIRVDEPKNQGFAKKCHNRSQIADSNSARHLMARLLAAGVVEHNYVL